ncbi:hypothetical protein JL720_9895 [Aureococcus anophagefferens]|nr:hypothetical protein JL720_9895 [Aureococcus anophagefferens]
MPLHAQSGLLAAEIGSRLDRATAAIQTGLDSASFAHRKAKGSDAAAWKAGTTKLRVFSMPAKRAKKIVRTSLICNSNRQIITVKHASSAGGETTRIVDVGDGTPTINVSLLERAEELLPDDARLPKVKLFLQELIFVLHIVNTKSWETDPSMPATFQGHADAMGKLMNEGQERFNGRLTGRKKRHSQNGGACNRGAELQPAVRDGRQVRLDRDLGRPLRAPERRADSVLDAATERRREERRDGAAALGAPPRRASA